MQRWRSEVLPFIPTPARRSMASLSTVDCVLMQQIDASEMAGISNLDYLAGDSST